MDDMTAMIEARFESETGLPRSVRDWLIVAEFDDLDGSRTTEMEASEGTRTTTIVGMLEIARRMPFDPECQK